MSTESNAGLRGLAQALLFYSNGNGKSSEGCGFPLKSTPGLSSGVHVDKLRVQSDGHCGHPGKRGGRCGPRW